MTQSTTICTILSEQRRGLGPSTEIVKWERYYADSGWRVIGLRGATDDSPVSRSIRIIPELKLGYGPNLRLNRAIRATDDPGATDGLAARILELAESLYRKLRVTIDDVRADALHVDQVLTYPYHLPAAVAVFWLADRDGLPVIGRAHDLLRERIERPSRCLELLTERFLLPAHPKILHLTLTDSAEASFRAARRTANVRTVPNLFDFDSPGGDRDLFRTSLGLAAHDVLLLQPSRVAVGKGIQYAIDLAAGLRPYLGKRVALVVTGPTLGGTTNSGSTAEYRRTLADLAYYRGVDVRFLGGRLDYRSRAGWPSVISLSDAFAGADLVTFPSVLEGFGNAVVESVAHRRPLFTAHYQVMDQEFLPKGFRFTVMRDPTAPLWRKEDGLVGLLESPVGRHDVAAVAAALAESASAGCVAAGNFEIGRRHYGESLENRERYIRPVLEWLCRLSR